MTKPNETWTVVPHGTLSSLEENLQTVTGVLEMPLGNIERRMTVARARSGELVVFSPICLSEPEMSKLEAFGRPAYMVVPNERHRLDIKPWKDRYPQLRVVAPKGALEKVSELVRVDATKLDLDDETIQYVEVPGTDGHEAALLVRSETGTTLVMNELIFNVPEKPGFGGWMMKLMGVTGDEPHMPGMIRHREVHDKAALSAQLAAWSRLPSLKRLVVSHGNVVDVDPAGALARIAAELVE